MSIKTKRWNDRRQKDDGFRLLTCRFRPRALKKEDETWDQWWPELGPSKELHAAHYGKDGATQIAWDEFSRRYKEEMATDQALEMIACLAELVSEGKTVTLLCSTACKDATRCHRSLLRELVEAAVARLQVPAVG